MLTNPIIPNFWQKLETSRAHISHLHSKWSVDSSSTSRLQPAKPGVCLEQKQLDVYRWCWRLCRAKLWFRFDWFFCPMSEWWRMHVEAQWFLYWCGSVPDGFKGIPSEERRTSHPALPWLTSDTAQRIAGARYCDQDSNALVHLCPNRFVCCVVYCPGSTSLT